jgi:hypothetical protein
MEQQFDLRCVKLLSPPMIFPDEPSNTIAGSLRNGLLITPPMPARFVNAMKFEAEKSGEIVRRAVEAIKKSKSHRRHRPNHWPDC